MAINHCIIHHLQRATEKGEITLTLRDSENTPEDAVVSLFTQLRQSFQRSASRQYGLFDPEQGDNPLPGWLKQLESENMAFATVARHIAEHFKQLLSQIDEAFDAHLFLVEEELIEEKFLWLFWLNHTDAQRIDSEQEVAPVQFVDASKLQYVMKLDFNQWQVENWQQYLSVITARGDKELAHAFLRAIGFVSQVNLKAQTDEFLGVVEAYAKSLPEQESKQAKHKIVDYCVEQDMQGNPINLETLSEVLDEKNPEAFASFAKEKMESPKEEIYTHRASIKKFVRFYGREKDLSISFSSDMMGENVIYNAESGELTLKKIPKSLQQQIARYLKDR